LFLEYKIFSGENSFFGRKIVSGVWLHPKKCFGKYSKVFGCVPENPLENTFFYIFSASKQIL